MREKINSVSRNKGHDLIVIDDFYESPDRVRAMAMSLPFASEPPYNHFERTPSYFPTGIADVLGEIVGRRLAIDENWLYPRTRDGRNPKTYNGTFYRVAADTNPPNHVHHDNHDYTAIVFLSPGCPAEYGTLFYAFRPTGACATTAPRPEGDEVSRRFGDDFSMWTCVDFVGNRFNRLVVFPSARYHGARIANDAGIERLGHLFLFNVEACPAEHPPHQG